MSLYDYIFSTMESYFTSGDVDKWRARYKNKYSSNKFDHDEPWLTLISMYSIFDNQSDLNSKDIIKAFGELIYQSNFNKSPIITEVNEVLLERNLPEIVSYREYLVSLYSQKVSHLYPDVNTMIREKLKKEKQSLEGSTNLDLQISFHGDERNKKLFVEAKFLSDIDTKTTYNPVRNQIIRNIDAMIDFVIKNEYYEFEDVYFALLTPKIFRTNKYGGGKSTLLNNFLPERGRYYCYIMNEYKDYKK